MTLFETLLIALALSVDAAVFAFSFGLAQSGRRLTAAFPPALCTGAFQGFMPLLGYLGGERISSWVGDWDHWIVLLVFGWLGGSIILNAFRNDRSERRACCGIKGLLIVGLATSVDALLVGVCLALGSFGGRELSPGGLAAVCALIGATTFLCALAAFVSSRLLRRFPIRWLETTAGLILIALGLQTLYAHLTAEPGGAVPADAQKVLTCRGPFSYRRMSLDESVPDGEKKQFYLCCYHTG